MFHKDILVTLEKTTKKSKVLIDYLSIFLGNSFISTMMQNLANFIETAGIKPNSRNIPQLLKGKGEFSSAGASQHGWAPSGGRGFAPTPKPPNPGGGRRKLSSMYFE